MNLPRFVGAAVAVAGLGAPYARAGRFDVARAGRMRVPDPARMSFRP